MSSKITLKNNANVELSIEHSDLLTKGKKVTYVDTIEQLEQLNGLDGYVCIVTDKDRGGTFIYDSSITIENDRGVLFNGWVRQYDGAVNIKWFGAVGDGITDDTEAIQKAIDIYYNIYVPKGVFLISGIHIIKNHMTIIGEGAQNAIIMSNGDYCFSFDNTTSSTTEGCKIEKIRFTSNNNHCIGITGDIIDNYIYQLGVTTCVFEANLQYGIKGNFLQAVFFDCMFGRYGSPNMLSGIYIEGKLSGEANANNIDSCYIANVLDKGIYIGTGEGNNIINTTIEITGKEAIHIDGGLVNSITNCYLEKNWYGNTSDGTESIVKTTNNSNGKAIEVLSIIGCMVNVGEGSNNGYFINCAGSANIVVQSCAFGGLSAYPHKLSTNNDKITFSNNNYYPGGFVDFREPRLVNEYTNNSVKTFNERLNSSISGSNSYLKTISHTDGDNISSGATVLGLLTNKGKSSSYNFLKCRNDIDGTPTTMFNLDGRGGLFVKTYVGGGADTKDNIKSITYTPTGAMAFNTDSGKPCWYNGTTWVYADGTEI